MADLRRVFAECDYPKGDSDGKLPNGFWRVDAAEDPELRWVWLFFVGHPEGFGERHGKSYLTRRRRGEEGGGGGSVTGGTVPSV